MPTASRTLALTALITTGVLSLGCRTYSEVPRPAWLTRSANLDHPDLVLVVGACRGQVGFDRARRCALDDARRQLKDVYGVRGGLIRGEHAEDRIGLVARGRVNQVTQVHDVWVLMGYPKRSLAR